MKDTQPIGMGRFVTVPGQPSLLGLIVDMDETDPCWVLVEFIARRERQGFSEWAHCRCLAEVTP
jgi:hypothetical protein